MRNTMNSLPPFIAMPPNSEGVTDNISQSANPKNRGLRRLFIFRMKYLLSFVLVFSVSAHASKWYEGNWTVAGAKFPGISAVGLEDIEPLVGTVGVVSSASVTLREAICSKPEFSESLFNKEEFELHYRATYEGLGFSQGSVSVVDIECADNMGYLFSHLIQNNGVTYGVWEGAFVVLVPSEPPTSSQEEGVPPDFLYKDVSQADVDEHKGKTLSAALMFEVFDDNTDYWYALFNNRSGDSLRMIVASDDLAEKLKTLSKGQDVTVHWEIGLFYEAGENDAPYYSWELLRVN